MQKKENLSDCGIIRYERWIKRVGAQKLRLSIYLDLLKHKSSMRIYIALIFTCISLIGFGQDLKKITKSMKTPDGWSVELVKDTTYMPMFGRKTVAIWKFECKTVKIKPVEFYVFDYVKGDSASMDQKAMIYYATSNCLVVSNEDIRQNSMNFIKGNYFFVEKMCPCYTTGTVECRTMVRQLTDWITNKDHTKEF